MVKAAPLWLHDPGHRNDGHDGQSGRMAGAQHLCAVQEVPLVCATRAVVHVDLLPVLEHHLLHDCGTFLCACFVTPVSPEIAMEGVSATTAC